MSEQKKITIAIVINTSWNIFNFRLGLLQALKNQGYKIIAIAPRDDYSQKLQSMGFEYHHISMNNKGTNPVQDLKLLVAFYKLYKKLKPDVILQYTIKPNIYGTIAAKLAGCQTINNISGLGTVFLNDHFSSKLARFMYRCSLRFANRVFFQNPHDRQLFIEHKLITESKTDLLPGSGINVDKYKPSKRAHQQGSSCIFLLVARMIRDKGVIEFVEAAGHLLNEGTDQVVEFWLLGDLYPGNPTAISADQLEQWQQDGVVKYLGHVDDVAAVIHKADCVVLPSYREGLSRVLLEAAAMAKPIITTDTPGCKDVVDHGLNGYLCAVKSSQDLALMMREFLLLEEQQRLKMGRNGRLKIERQFDEKIVIDKYSSAIRALIAHKSGY